MTPEELRALPVTVDLATAARALGIGRDKARQAILAGEFPCKVMRLGVRYRVITQGPDGLLAACGIGPAAARSSSPATYPPA